MRNKYPFLILTFLLMVMTFGFADENTPTKLDRLQILEKIVLGFEGYELPLEIEKFLRSNKIAGIILFDRNIHGSDQLKRLTNSIREASLSPLKILVDQEGGRVARLRPETGFNLTFPSAAELGKKPVSESFASGYMIGKLLKAMGIDMNLAPVVDLAIPNGYIGSRGRSFGNDVEEVAQRAAAFLKGMSEWGIQGCLKHFPGHGSARLDPHHDFTDVTHLYEAREVDSFYRNLEIIGEDFNPYPALLLGHLVHKDWDENCPASFSKKVIHDKVKSDLKFKGIVMTDDMDMGAVGRSTSEAVKLALEAGIDWILLCDTQPQDKPHPPDQTIYKIESLLENLL